MAEQANVPELYHRTPSYQERRRAVRRRRAALLLVLAAALTATGVLLLRARDGGTAATAAEPATAAAPPAAASTGDEPTTTEAGGATTAQAATPAAAPVHVGRPSDRTRLRLLRTITGDIAPKSVASSGTGFVTAQNMMYRHSVTVYNARTMKLVRTIPDAVDLSKLGYPEHPGTSQGAPVEAAFSPDGLYAYVSNYSMYGPTFGPEGTDTCVPESGYDRSFVYRINMESLRIDRAYKVGAVPKVVKATPDGRYVLVANWCTWDLSVISTDTGREVRRVPIGPYPRGIAITPKGGAAYVAVMGDTKLVRVDLETWKTRSIQIGSGPRALEFAPEGRWAYATLNSEGRVAKLDLYTGRTTTVETGSAPRSLAMSTDGRALYVVNYDSGTVSKVRTRDMTVVQEIEACQRPIGVTYDAHTARVWVACYSGEILVFADR